jgi:hypothetical protein
MPEQTRELSPLASAWAGTAWGGAAGGGPPPRANNVIRQQVARLHSVYGNQAILRMLAHPTPVIQTKLTVNQPGDQYEQEADRVADQVMRMSAPVPLVQRSCSACQNEENEEKVQRKCAACEQEENKSAEESHFRCDDSGECTEDEPQYERDLLGVATCNYARGVVEAQVFKEHCAGDCVAQHEQAHVEDTQLCCNRYGRCMHNAADLDGRNRCREAWQRWFQLTDDYSECNAYNREGLCLNDLINKQCRASGGPVSEDCCKELQGHLDVVGQRIGKHCPNGSTPFPCFFAEDGSILPF